MRDSNKAEGDLRSHSPGFTPGRWAIDEDTWVNTRVLYVRTDLHEREPVIAEIDPHGSASLEDTCEADARLIAAAPDLYATLRELLYWARHERDGGPCDRCDPGNEGSEIWGELTGKIEGAIAKTQGNAPKAAPSSISDPASKEGKP